MPITRLDTRVLVAIGGAAASDFLQNLITLDIARLQDGEARPSALLTPQGKVLFDFLLSRDGDGFRADIRADIADDFIKRLTLYRLRAAVTFEKLADVPVLAGWDGLAPAGAIADTRFAASAWRLHGDRASGAVTPGADSAHFDLQRIRHGVAESGADYALSDAWPHDILFDLNGGVGMKKGCYVGQEVVSRMHHRKTARRRLAIVGAAAPLSASGTAIEAAGRALGELGTVVGNEALAIVRVDRVADALTSGTPITAAGALVTLALPEWSGLSFEAGPGGDD